MLLLELVRQPRPRLLFYSSPKVTVIWAFPRFRYPHSQNPSDMGTTFSYYPNDLGYRGCPCHKGLGDAHINVAPERVRKEPGDEVADKAY